MNMPVITPKEMQLRDVCEMLCADGSPFGTGFTTCMVTQVKEDHVELTRPFGVTSNFSYTGGVIPYVGMEKYNVYFSQTGIRYRLISRLPCK